MSDNPTATCACRPSYLHSGRLWPAAPSESEAKMRAAAARSLFSLSTMHCVGKQATDRLLQGILLCAFPAPLP